MFIPVVYAQCPVCVVTVGGGLFLAKWLGIDDILASIWLSGLNTAIAFWIASGVKSKILKNGWMWSLAFFILTIGYLAYSKQIGHPGNTFLGIDRVLFGTIIGYLVSLLAISVDKLLRKTHKGKVYFPYQKVIIPLVSFIVVSGVFAILIEFIHR